MIVNSFCKLIPLPSTIYKYETLFLPSPDCYKRSCNGTKHWHRNHISCRKITCSGNVKAEGSASIYQYNGNNWVLMQKIPDATGAATDNFGISVSISGNYAVVGAYGDDVGTNGNQASATIFLRMGLGW